MRVCLVDWKDKRKTKKKEVKGCFGLEEKHSAERYSKEARKVKNGRFLLILEVVIRELFVGLLGVLFFFLTWSSLTSKFVHELCDHGFEADLMKSIFLS